MSQYMRNTASSRQRSGGGSTTPRSAASEISRTSNDPKKAKLRDTDFRKRVLLTRRISFPSATESSDAFAHFETELPSEGYAALEQMQHTNVWIPTDDQLIDNVIREFTYMQNEQLCEAEFASYTAENLLRRDSLYPSYEETREWRVERMIELLVKPSTSANSRLRPPPAIVSADSLEYDFNFKPDIQYWLSVRSFNPDYVRLFSRYIYIHNDRITAPYFTTEYKKDDKSMERAKDQIATAAAMALYNRCLLKIERLKETRKRWTAKHTSSLRHYGLTLQGASYTFWCVRLKSIPEPVSPHEWSWPGCDVVEATTGNMLSKANVQHFIHWVNEIHRWGLSVHGPSCEKDVKFCIEGREKNVRTSLYESRFDPDSDDEISVHAK
ncbi:hypothetical protein MANI_024871 [Metarhizium anisopliae]